MCELIIHLPNLSTENVVISISISICIIIIPHLCRIRSS